METIGQDVRAAVRGLGRSGGFGFAGDFDLHSAAEAAAFVCLAHFTLLALCDGKLAPRMIG